MDVGRSIYFWSGFIFQIIQSQQNLQYQFQVQAELMQSLYQFGQATSKQDYTPPLTMQSNLPNLCYLDYSHIISELTIINYRLNFEVTQLKQALQNSTMELENMKSKCLEDLRLREKGEVGQKKKNRKIFKKDKYCPIQGCGNRYSSKIAVKAHIRKHHLRLPPVPRNKE